ncbi:hypothetical protein ACIA5G_13000 [Amycolatopsis sp. NPDC051758]|uniref:hypothetical protein n=1 Tax=Amycolatopsis sp. NPDC051758 TaxID=3363935 RepID=UPI0037B4E4FC
MTEGVPTWPEVFGRLQAAGFRTVTGVIRYRVPGDGEGELRFWHEVPGRWRVEDEHGVRHVTDGRRELVRRDGRLEDLSHTGFHHGLPHPQSLFGLRLGGRVEFDWLRDFPAPERPGEPAEVGGRQAWEFALPAVEHKRARKPYPLRVAVDQATGAVLRLAVPEGDYFVELTEFTVDGELPPDVFTWAGPVSTRLADERAEAERVGRWLAGAELPMPRWWPRGLPHHGGDGDPATGAYRVLLEVPGFPELSRWPAGAPMPGGWDGRHEGRHVHRWSDRRWEWALAVDEPLSEPDLARVVESIPDA